MIELRTDRLRLWFMLSRKPLIPSLKSLMLSRKPLMLSQKLKSKIHGADYKELVLVAKQGPLVH